MISSVLSTLYIPIVLIVMVDGTEMTAVGDTYPSFESCMVQAEHDAKVMAREIEAIENELPEQVISRVSIVCEPMGDDYPAHLGGYLPLEEARYVPR